MCIKAGALDYVMKWSNMTRLPFAVKEALEQVSIQKRREHPGCYYGRVKRTRQNVFAVAPVGIRLVVNRVILR